MNVIFFVKYVKAILLKNNVINVLKNHIVDLNYNIRIEHLLQYLPVHDNIKKYINDLVNYFDNAPCNVLIGLMKHILDAMDISTDICVLEKNNRLYGFL